MKIYRALVFIVVIVLISVPLSTGTAPEVIVYDPVIIEQPLQSGVQRTVMLEEFTFVTCHYCHELADGVSGGTGLYGTVDSYGLDKIAPLWLHTNGGSDPMFALNPQPPFERFYNYYGGSANPYTWIDGYWHEDSEIEVPEDPVIHSWFDERLLIPANISIMSNGSITGNTGTITIQLEAVNDINITDLVLHSALWEDHIEIDPRFYDPGDPPGGSPPSGEFRYAMWDMVPNAFGTPIWPNGAKRWDTLEITHDFDIDPTWNVNENMLGMSVWVQCNSSQLVEQAHVEDFGNFNDHPPTIDISTAGILSGTENIVWNATDLEDSALDITLECSPDGGDNWFVLESGIDNNDGSYTWDTTIETDGVNYIMRLSATDSSPQTTTRTFRQPFSIDNTLNDEWFFQVEGNPDLDMKPCETNLTDITTTIPAPGQYLIDSWETTNTFNYAEMNGNWTFNVYGYTTNDAFSGSLFAKIFASSDPVTPLNITILDDENVGDHQTSHLFTWTDNLQNVIPDGDSLIVELWLDIDSGGGTTPEQTLSDFDAGSAGWEGHHWRKQNLNSPVWQATGGNTDGWAGVELWYYVGGPEPMPDDGSYWEHAFKPSGTPQNAELSFDWICSQWGPTNTAKLFFYVFIDTVSGTPTIGSEVWTIDVSDETTWASVGPLDVSGIVNSASTYYLKIAVWEENTTKQTLEIAGYDNVNITWETTEAIFIMENDYSTTQSSLMPSIEQNYAIGVDVGWNFISTPFIPDNTSIPGVLTDLDGDTSWTILQYYDPVEQWKTWADFKPLNDLGNLDHKMGVWLYIPDAVSLGDGFIRIKGSEPASSSIGLKAGWNMVGYPSFTERMLSDALSGTGYVAVEGFNSSAPYRINSLADTYMMTPGEAYWIKVDSDTTWTVDW